MSAPVRILVVGTGAMAHSHAEAFSETPGCRIVAAVDVDEARAADFAARHDIPTAYGSLAAAIAAGGFDAAVNVTPDGAHRATTLPLLAARLPVLCEKPLAVTWPDAVEMADAAAAAGVVNMVNFTYRNAAALQQARAMVAAGDIGRILHVQASYLQSWLTSAHWGDWRKEPSWLWRLSTAQGSRGVLGDVGVHILDFATYAANEPIVGLSARLRTFDKAPGDRIGDYVLDANDSMAMTVDFAGGALGVVHATRMATGKSNDLDLLLHGEAGALRIWTDGKASTLEACLGPDIATQTWRTMDCPPTPRNAERFVAAVAAGAPVDPDFRRGAEMQRLIDLAFESDAEGRRLAVA